MRRVAAALAFACPALSFAASNAPALEAETWYARYALSGGRSEWTETGLQVGARYPSRFAWSGYARQTERFDLRDTEGGGTLYAPFGSGWAAAFEATASSTHRVLARHSLFGELEKQLGHGWIVRGGLRRSEYESGRADLRLATLERYFGSERVAYTFYSGQAEQGGSAPAHRLDWTHYFGERGSFGLSAARGREVDNIPPEGVLVSDVRSASLSATYWVSAGWAASLVAEATQQGNLYRRNGIRLGLRHRF